MGLALYGDIFYRNVMASGVVPQISLILGNCAGGHVYSPALTDFNLMVDGGSAMMITGPDVIKTVTGEDISIEDLGGARAHNSRSGVAHFMSDDEDEALETAKTLLGYLPSNNLSEPPAYDSADVLDEDPLTELDTLIPDSNNAPYDMHTVIEAVLDEGDFLEVQQLWAPNMIVGFGRVEGRSVGVVGNNPMQLAGTLDIDASEKAARFVRTCDAFNIPILTFCDVPGFLPGVGQEHAGIIRRGAKLLYAYSEATVPKVTVITRKAYGGAYVVMGSKHLGADVNLAWPTAQVAVVGAQGAVNIVRRKEIAAAADPDAGPRGVHHRVRGHLRQPLHRRRAGLRRRGDRAEPDPPRGGEGAAGAAHQAPDPAAEEAREHPAVSDESAAPPRPLLRVVRGEPSPAELAALVAVLAARSGGGEAAAEPAPVGGWADRASALRRPLHPGPGAWAASLR